MFIYTYKHTRIRGADPLTGSHNVMYEASSAAAPSNTSQNATITFESSTHFPKKAMVSSHMCECVCVKHSHACVCLYS